jgi:prepilin-type N-terminal cleavage/methylation domain-containing protein
MKHTRRRRHAFTLVELLVVVAIIAVLIAMLLPSLGKAKFLAKLAACGGNLRQIGVGVLQYTVEYKGYYPTLGYNPSHPPDATKIGRRLPFSAESTPAGILGSYFGYPDDKCDWRMPVFQCPQGVTEAWWDNRNRSASGNRGTSHSGWRGFYSLYFDLYGAIDGGGNSYDGKMRRVNDSFTTRHSRKQFRLMGSDHCNIMRIAHASNSQTGWMTNHIWGGDRNWSWNDPGAAHFSYGPLYFNSTTGLASSNWMFDDGAVVRMRESDITYAVVDWTEARGAGSSESFDVPTEFAID